MSKTKLPNRPVGPFPTVIVGVEVDGKPNYVTIGACGVVSLDPVLYISLKTTHYSTPGVVESGWFSVNIPSAAMAEQTDYCGTFSGRDTDKSKLFTPFYDEQSRTPMIAECPMNFLCKVFQTFPIRGFEMFFGEIMAAYADGRCLTEGHVDPAKVDPLIMMSPSYYGLGQAAGRVFMTRRS